MSQALTAALGRPVRFREVPVSAIGSPDMAAMWRFLRACGYQADIAALRHAYPTVGWTSFTTWAERTFRPSGGQVTHAPPPSAALLPSGPGGRVGQVRGGGLLTDRNVPDGRAEAQVPVRRRGWGPR